MVNGGGFQEDRLDFDRSGFGTLTAWAEAISFERALVTCTHIQREPELLARAKALGAWYVPVLPDGRMIAKAGHEGYREPGVVCTTPDSYAAFVSALEPDLSRRVKQRIISGSELCEEVRAQSVDALYLNPFGPGPSLVFPKGVFDLVAIAGPPPKPSMPAPPG